MAVVLPLSKDQFSRGISRSTAVRRTSFPNSIWERNCWGNSIALQFNSNPVNSVIPSKFPSLPIL